MASPVKRPQLSLSDEVVQAGPTNTLAAGNATPANGTRPNLDISIQTGTPSFRGSGVRQAGEQPLRGYFAQNPPEEVKTDGCEEAPPVLPSPTNALRQPMMPRSTRSVRSTVHAANWGPSVSSALATSIPIRPATAPQRPMGYQKPNLEMNVDDLPCIPQASLETPTNAQRQPMMSRSSRSARHQVLVADAENSTPTVYAGTPKPRGLTLTALDTDLDTSTLKLSGMATPTNLDRKNAQMSLQMGTPSFRGSATPSGVVRVPPLPTGSGIRPG